MPARVEALERMGRSLWLRCTLAVVQGLTAHIPGTVIYPGQQEIPKYLLVHFGQYSSYAVIVLKPQDFMP